MFPNEDKFVAVLSELVYSFLLTIRHSYRGKEWRQLVGGTIQKHLQVLRECPWYKDLSQEQLLLRLEMDAKMFAHKVDGLLTSCHYGNLEKVDQEIRNDKEGTLETIARFWKENPLGIEPNMDM